jgi:voltage-gated potassium channel|tara:strand:- start:1281 stop:1835 length:555 start_codon:yes stop_codon:yes gene_type:complete
MGLIDLLAIIPTYLMFIADLHHLTVIRSIRLIRLFRVFHLSPYVRGGQTMLIALRKSFPKIVVFLMSVILLVIVLGTVMYIIEGPSGANTNGFDDIPNSMYWAIITLTTVGYGGVVPFTVLGKILASIIMILGYGIIAVPTGIVSVSMVKNNDNITTITCPNCLHEGHIIDSDFCNKCGKELNS